MIKGYALIPKKPEISLEQFHRHWREVHAPLALRIKALKRYVQAHRIPAKVEGFSNSPYEGFAEIWFEDLQTGLDLGGDPDYLNGAYLDEPNFISDEGPSFLMTRENVVIAGPELAKDAPGVKAVVLVKRKRGLTVAEYQDYWRTGHAALVPKTPGLQRYVQSHVAPETYESGAPAYDGVAELWWQDMAAFERGWLSEEVQVEQFKDASNFVDFETSVGLLVEETRVIWP